jgi:hypothetical protein
VNPNHPKTDIERKAHFVVFCIGILAERRRISRKDSYFALREGNVLSYLEDHYGVLHTQGKEYLLADMEELLQGAA